MFTLSAMFAATSAKVKARARYQCYAQTYAVPRFAKNKPSTTKSGGYMVEDETGRYREFKFRVRCTEGYRKVAIRFHGPLNVNTRCWCWCSCPYFKFNCEVALASKGSSVVVQSNGQRPRFTNPTEDPRVCKHVMMAFSIALRRRQPGVDPEVGSLNAASGQRPAKVRQRERVIWAGDRELGDKARTFPK
jgi:hypothetical protein